MLKQYKFSNYRFRLIAYCIALSIIGIMTIGSAKASLQNKQIYGLVAALIIMFIVSLIDYKLILKFRRPIYLLSVVLLGLVLSPLGSTHGGATRWIEFHGFQFQPSELVKIMMIVFFAALFTKYNEVLNTTKFICISVILFGVVLALILKEPDLSTSIVFFLIFITLLFIAGLSYKIVIGALAVCVPLGIVGLILLFKEMLPLKDYQYGRILSWRFPERFPDDARQQQNSIIAIGSGQLWGKGLNNSSILSMKNANYISEPQTDFIYTIIGEELGFVGCIIVIVLVLCIVIECVLIARMASDLGGRLIAIGMAALIGFQSFINISVTTGLMPNTGLPLPFVSYGLTSLVSIYIGVGIVLNVGLQNRKRKLGDFD